MALDLALGLTEKVAVVTGAAGDIGRSTVELLLGHGMRIVAEDVNADVKQLERSGKVVALVADVSKEDSAKQAIALAGKHFGGLDVLVNNAGKTLNKSVLETTAEEWDDIMAVNARGYFLHAREAVRAMLERGSGAIVIELEPSVHRLADVVERHMGSGQQLFVDYKNDLLAW